MTQEELDAMMNGDIEIDEDVSDAAESSSENEEDSDDYGDAAKDYKVNAGQQWPPPPPTSEHKVVHQLDEVTKDSEENAGQIFDVLEQFSNGSMDIDNYAGEIDNNINEIKATFEKLQESFPKINTFSEQITKCDNILEKSNQIVEIAQNLSDQSLVAMDMMQYQDIHRQKIERVINVMRSLSKYMSSLFEGKIDDEKRVSSATHIQGDSTDDVVDENDIEALIAAFGSKD